MQISVFSGGLRKPLVERLFNPHRLRTSVLNQVDPDTWEGHNFYWPGGSCLNNSVTVSGQILYLLWNSSLSDQVQKLMY